MAKMSQRELQEQRELEEFIAQRSQRRKEMAKRVLIIIVCVGLVIAFCFPAMTMLVTS